MLAVGKAAGFLRYFSRRGRGELTWMSVMKALAIVFLLVCCALQARLWHGPGSLAEWHALQEQIARQQAENDRLRDRNALLKMDVEDLKSGLDGIEERARHELGLVKKGEVFYRIVKDS